MNEYGEKQTSSLLMGLKVYWETPPPVACKYKTRQTVTRVLGISTERGELAGGSIHSCSKNSPPALLRSRSPCSQGAHQTAKMGTLNCVFQDPQGPSNAVPSAPARSPALSLPSTLQSIRFFFLPSCKFISLPSALLFTQPAPSPPSGLRLDAASYRKPSWCLWSMLWNSLLERACFLLHCKLAGQEQGRRWLMWALADVNG